MSSPHAPLSGSALRFLRALGHDLKPIVRVGKEGVTEPLVLATKAALLQHELVKCKLLAEVPLSREEAATQLASQTGAVLAQLLGRTVLLYQRHPSEPKIKIPLPRETRGPVTTR